MGIVGKPCRYPRCPNVIQSGQYCEKHKDEEPRAFGNKREPKNAFYDSKAWRQARSAKLAFDPICERCGRKAATVVHHKQKFREHPELAFTLSNLESVCESCHNRETARENAERRKS